MSSYPVAQYRNSSQPRYPPAFKPGALPVPANDNIPTPANDNWRPPMPKARVNANLPKWSTAARIARGSGRVLGRAVPILGWVLTAWDLWNFYQVRPEGIEGYELVRRCKPGRGVFKQNGQANCSITIEMDPWLYPATVPASIVELARHSDLRPGFRTLRSVSTRQLAKTDEP